MTREISASREVLGRHIEMHPCRAGTHQLVCPCGNTVVLVCDACEEPIFMAVAPSTWCEHARELGGDSR